MSERLYHPEVYLPPWFEMPTGEVTLAYSKHALRAAREDRYGQIDLPSTLDLSDFYLVECGVEGTLLSKIVVRGRYDDYRDVIFVLCPGHHFFVKTVWFNLQSDTHRSLRRDRYATR